MTDARCLPPLGDEDLTDAQFDALFSPAVRKASRMYWTSVSIARRAAKLFAEHGARRVLDIGSGPGKFCILAAAHVPELTFVGVEHRSSLVETARSLAAESALSNVLFEVGDATRVSWKEFDGFYVYNSFAENDFPQAHQFDRTVELTRKRHLLEAKLVATRLGRAPVGRVVITHHGMSGPIPGSYELAHTEAAGTGWLRVWKKGTAEITDKYWIEAGEDVTAWTAPPPRTP